MGPQEMVSWDGDRQVDAEGRGWAQTQSAQPGGGTAGLCVSHPLASVGIKVHETVLRAEFRGQVSLPESTGHIRYRPYSIFPPKK